MDETVDTMLSVLSAPGPPDEHAVQLMVYGRFVGAWQGTVIVYRRDGTTRNESCEVYFDWVLEGRAIQDVWIAPARKDRTEADRDASKDMYGTTIRVYQPDSDTWDVTWIDPGTQAHGRMTGRKQGGDIVQAFQDEEGSLWQWYFTEITDDSFHWIARSSEDEGASWQVRNEFFLRRTR